MTNRQYPIGKFTYTGPYTPSEREQFIQQIESLPARLDRLVLHLTEAQLATPYRDGGWTARQVINHLADSHMHIFLRFKFALAEDGASISSYPEELWAQLPDSFGPIKPSVDLLRALHAKWGFVLRHMNDADFSRSFNHPQNGPVTLDRALGTYTWHGNHHLAHIGLVLND